MADNFAIATFSNSVSFVGIKTVMDRDSILSSTAVNFRLKHSFIRVLYH